MILVDYSQLIIASCLAFPDDFKKGGDVAKMQQIIRHTTLQTLLSYKQKFGSKYGDIVLCGDGRNYWRKAVFPYYKAHRKAAREESGTDWKALFDFAREFSSELREVFPWKFVTVDDAESDDVVATLVEFANENLCISSGLVEEAPPILIISSDGDLKQLHKHKNIKQYNPIMKKMVDKPEPDFLFEKIVRGDSGDGIPNSLSADDFLVNGEGRAKAITAKVKERFRTGQINEVEQRNFERNRMLIDFDYIPADLKQRIVNTYLENESVKDLNKVMNYLMANRMRMLLDRVQDFRVAK